MPCCYGGNGDEVILIFKTQAGLLTGNFRVAFLAIGMLVGLGIKDQPDGEASAKKIGRLGRPILLLSNNNY